MKTFHLLFIIPILCTQLHAQCIGTYQATLDANNVKTSFVMPEALFWDLDNAKYEVPKVEPGSGQISKHSLFCGSLWMGGIDGDGTLRVAAGTYRQTGNDFFPGPLSENGELIEDACTNFDYVWEINKSEVVTFINSDFQPNLITDNIRNWPGKNNPLFTLFDLPQNLNLAPFIDVNNDGIYNPLDGDYPICKGDQNFWWVFNDLADIHTETGGYPLGVQIAGYAYSITSDNFLNNTTFWEFEMINKSNKAIFDFYTGFFIDVDLGNHLDDYIGCYPERNIAFAYNGDAIDDGTAGYGENPPIIGIETLDGVINNNNINTLMSAFMTYTSDFSLQGNPEFAIHFYNVLQAKWKNGDQILDSGFGYGYGGTPTTYFYYDNPSNPEGWSECGENMQPNDRRFVTSSGPDEVFFPNEKQTVKHAIYWIPNVPHPCPDVHGVLATVSDSMHAYLDTLTAVTNPSKISNEVIKVFPNPTTKFLNIDFGNLSNVSLTITNLKGKQVGNFKKINANQKIDVSNFPTGQYLLSLHHKGKLIHTEKVLILK